MLAARITKFGPPEVLQLERLPVPIPAAGEALVRIHACGVNRMDTKLRAGVYGGEPIENFFFGRDLVLPHVPGIEPAGVVEQSNDPTVPVGTRVVPHSHLACGRCAHCIAGHDNACPAIRVLGVQTPDRGGYAEYFTWPSASLLPFSGALDLVTAAALLVNYGPVWNGLVERAQVRAGETLLVTGAAGGCGHAALDVGRMLGLRTLALTRSPDKRDALHAAGADLVVIDHGDDRWPQEVADLTAGAGADVVIELVGAATFAGSVRAAALRGRVVVIGSHAGLHAALNLGELFGKNLSLHGVTRAPQSAMARVLALAEQRRVRPLIGAQFALADVVSAHRLMDDGKHTGKIVVTMN